MFLDRQDTRKEVEQAYRKQLKNQVESKRSRISSNRKDQEFRPERESFSLIANIEREQNERKKKSEQYYDDLRQQMDLQKREKQQLEADKKRKELEEEDKLREEQRKLQERYEEEIRKENKGKKNPAQQPKVELPQPKKRKQFSVNRQQPPKREPSQNQPQPLPQRPSFMQTPEQYNFQTSTDSFPLPAVSLYPNRPENETYNYAPRSAYKDNYYKQLLGQRRRLEEEANQISELNRIFNAERYKRREESRGLEQLRNLEKMLDGKNVEYLDIKHPEPRHNHPTEPAKLKPLTKVHRSSTFSQKINKDQWRKLD